MRTLALILLAACGSSPPAEKSATAPVPATPPTELGCPLGIAEACARYQAIATARPNTVWKSDAPGLARCATTQTPTGAWRYALVAPLLEPTETITPEAFAASKLLVASADTKRALALDDRVATVEGRPTVDATHWAIVPAHELVPAWKVITVGTEHPITGAATGPLVVPLCGDAPIANIDPAKVTTIAMTGTTAPTRLLARLMDAKGTTYPARDVKAWFAGTDFVHVSNEVSFTKLCKNPGEMGMSFCARESYIELLEEIGASIIELTGSHLTDYGRQPFRDTLAMYEARGWKTFGGGRDQNAATRPLELEHHGNRIAFVGCNMVKTDAKTVWHDTADVAVCDMARLDWQIRDLARRGFIPIVSIQHWEVYVHDPPKDVVTDFRTLADTGAAVVFGSQAHCAHPFEVHHGAFLHYGAGNLFFDQEASNTRDGVVDRLIFHDGKLLTVGHLYTRIEEHGRPRPLTDRERAGFLKALGTSQARLAPADPFAPASLTPPTRYQPDSFLVKNQSQRVIVYPPAKLEPGKTYPLVIAHAAGATDLATLSAGVEARATADAFLVAPLTAKGAAPSKELVAAIKTFALAKFPIDPARVVASD